MELPFTRAEFFAVFASYNDAVWPAQIAIAGAALAAVRAAWTGRSGAATWLLALLWAWMGVVYHWAFFQRVNPAAALFGAVFLAEAALLAGAAMGKRVPFEAMGGWRGAAGWALVAFAAVMYPIWGLATGHEPRELPVLGVPCPTTILTLGLLFWVPGGPPRRLLVIPVLWSLVGGSAAFILGVPQDLGLLVAGALAAILFRRPAG